MPGTTGYKKIESFADENRIRYASQITRTEFDIYVEILEELEFTPSSVVTEMVLLKSPHQFWIDVKKFDPRFAIKYTFEPP